MGYFTAYHTAMMAYEGDFSMEEAVRLHLSGNVMPPATEFTEAGTKALEACLRDDWEALIELPDGEEMEAIELVDQLSLNAFLDVYGEDQ